MTHFTFLPNQFYHTRSPFVLSRSSFNIQTSPNPFPSDDALLRPRGLFELTAFNVRTLMCIRTTGMLIVYSGYSNHRCVVTKKLAFKIPALLFDWNPYLALPWSFACVFLGTLFGILFVVSSHACVNWIQPRTFFVQKLHNILSTARRRNMVILAENMNASLGWLSLN